MSESDDTRDLSPVESVLLAEAILSAGIPKDARVPQGYGKAGEMLGIAMQEVVQNPDYHMCRSEELLAKQERLKQEFGIEDGHSTEELLAERLGLSPTEDEVEAEDDQEDGFTDIDIE